MMRTPFVAGNWKMNKTVAEACAFVTGILPALAEIKGVEKVLCPSYMALAPVAALLKGSDVGLGAQNLHWKEKGAFTGEVAPGMVKEYCQYVIIGHSERRAYFGESDETVHMKIEAARTVGLIPIVCIGETLAQRESECTAQVVARQVMEGLKGFPPDFARTMVVAYEPVWAIGTGRAASGEDAEAVVRDVIRPALSALYGESIAQAIRVLYGGSVTAANAAEFFSQPDIDGALVGGASLKEEFVEIVRAARK